MSTVDTKEGSPVSSTATKRRVGFLTALALILTLLTIIQPVGMARADVFIGTTGNPADSEFEKPVFDAQVRGNLIITGNALTTCDIKSKREAKKCADTLAGKTRYSNNHFRNIIPVKADPAAPDKVASMVHLEIPDGAEVLYAGVVWSGIVRNKKAKDTPSDQELMTAQFKLSGQDYQTVTAGKTTLFEHNAATNAYASYADVTSIVQQGGSGDYWLSDVYFHPGGRKDDYAGWSLVVAVKDPKQPFRDLKVFNGFRRISNRSNERTTEIPVKGFTTPAYGPVKANLGVVAFEGDKAYSGDYLEFNDKRVSDAASLSNNFFNSSVTVEGVNNPDRNPASVNTIAVDAKMVNVDGFLANGAEEANVKVGTVGDWIYPAVIATQIDLYVPEINPVKTVTNLDRADTEPVQVGDTLEYTVTAPNTGMDGATDVVVTDKLPANVEYVAGSLTLTQKDGSDAPLTDQAGDDAGEVGKVKDTDETKTVTVRLGKGATDSAGGEIAPNGTRAFKFRVKVLGDAGGKPINNQVEVSYRGKTVDNPDKPPLDGTSEVVSSPVAPAADLVIEKTGPATVKAGEEPQWTLTVTNHGPSTAEVNKVTDLLPDGVSFVSATGADCAVDAENASRINCDLADLANGESTTITITGSVAATEDTQTKITNAASVRSEKTKDPDETNNSASAVSQLVREADLVLEKTVTATGGQFNPGALVTYTLTATNKGPSTARETTLTDTLPEGLSIVGNDIDDRCTVSARTVTCDFGTFEPGEDNAQTITINARLSSRHNATDPLTNKAVISSKTTDPNRENNKATASFTPTEPTSDLGVTKRVVDAQGNDTDVEAGMPIKYQIEVTNYGPSLARNVTVEDALPAGLSNVSVSTQSGTCTEQDGTVSCEVGDLAVGASTMVTVTADVDPSVTGTLENTATTSSGSTDPNPGNDSATSSEPVVVNADLAIAKTTTQTPIAGEDLTYTVTVHNHGPADAEAVTVTDFIPDGLTFVSGSAGCADNGDGTVGCSLGNMALDEDKAVELTFHVPSDFAKDSEIYNVVSVGAETDDPVGNNNQADHTLTTGTSADVILRKKGGPAPVAGQRYTWEIDVLNAGASRAEGIVVTDELPDAVLPGTAHTAYQIVRNDGTQINGSCEVTGREVTCVIDYLEPFKYPEEIGSVDYGQAMISITGLIDPDYLGDSMTNSASSTSGTDDPALDNNDSSKTTAIKHEADLGVTKSGPEKATAGNQAQWTVTVENHGPSYAKNVVLTDMLPDGVTFVSSSSEDGITCEEQSDATVECTLEGLDGPNPEWLDTDSDAAKSRTPVTAATVVITGLIDSDVEPETELENTVTVTSDTPEPAGATHPNKATSTTKIEAEADLSIIKETDPADTEFVTGSTGKYSLFVSNVGPSTARTVTVTDTLPEGVTPTAVSLPDECSIESQTVTCNFETVPVGEEVRAIHIDVDVAADAPDTVVNTATVSSPTDRNSENNEGTIETPTTDSADLLVVKTANHESVNAGQQITYTLKALNRGPSTAETVTISDTIPEGLTFVEASDECTYSETDRLVTCALGNMTSGAIKRPTIKVRVPADSTATSVENTAVISSKTTDPDRENDTSTVETGITTLANLSIKKDANPTTGKAGEEQTWSLVVTNKGPSVARKVNVTDTMPEGLTVTSATMEDGTECTVNGQEITCDIGDLPVLATTIRVVAQIPAGFTGTKVTNTATVSSKTPDTDDSDNESSSEVPVKQVADLSVTKTYVSDDEPVAGSPVAYDIVVTNEGPSISSDVALNDEFSTQLADVSATGTLPDGTPVQCTVEGDANAEDTDADADNGGTADSDDTPDSDTADNGAPATNADDASGDPGADTADDSAAGTDESATGNDDSGSATDGSDATDSDDAGDTGNDDDAADDSDPAVTTSISCELGTLKVGESVTIRVTGTLDSAHTGNVSNTATVTSKTTDPNGENDTATVENGTTPTADLAIEKTADSEEVAAGEPITYTLKVTNTGPSDATEVTVTDTLPAGLEIVEVDDRCTTEENALTCTLGTIKPNGEDTVTVKVNVPADADAGDVENTAAVTTTATDPNKDNNESEATVKVTPQADVKVTNTIEAGQRGEKATLTSTVTNDGPSVARDVKITIPVSLSLTDVTVTATGPNGTVECTLDPDTGVVTCPVGDLKPGETVKVTITGTLRPDSKGDLVHPATVESTTLDPKLENNEDTVSVTPGVVADLAIAKQLVGAAKAGEPVQWKLTVTSDGPSTAYNVLVTDALPETIEDAHLLPGVTGCDITDRVLTCEVAELAPDGTYTVSVLGTLASTATGNLVNEASVSSDTADPDLSNNEASTSDPITPAPKPSPSVTPSVSPSVPPTAEPTVTPSGEPSVDVKPSAEPKPTITVSVTPSKKPGGGLAITGVDVGMQALAALALLLVGFLFVAIRMRRKADRQS